MERKKKTCKTCNKETYIFSKGNCESCSKKLKLSLKPKEKVKKEKKRTRSQIVKELDRVFSLYIRYKGSENDYGTCYTCDKVLPIGSLQCGHFISRSNYTTRWLEVNCKKQCVGCNVFKSGNYIEYTLRMQKELGEKAFNELLEKGRETVKFSNSDLEDMINHYTFLLASLSNKGL